ncbi:MAG: hypothetical protein ACPGVE_07040, partial [Flavobacteriales bacterium]
MKTYKTYLSIFFALLLSLVAQAQTIEPVYNYITPSVYPDSVKVRWEFETTATPLDVDSFTFGFGLENAEETDSFYVEVTAKVKLDSTGIPWTIPTEYNYQYSVEKNVPFFDLYYTHQVTFNGEVYDKLLGTGVNYFYDELKYNPSYPKAPFNATSGYGEYHLTSNQFNYVTNQTEPDFIAYKTTLCQATWYGAIISSGPFNIPNLFLAPFDPSQPVFYGTPSVLLQGADTNVSTTFLLTHPDTIPHEFYMDAQNFDYKSYLFYPVYSQEICLGDQFEVNSEVVISSGLYLDSLTT